MLDLAAVFYVVMEWINENKGYKLQSVFLFGGLGLSFVTYFLWFIKKGYKTARIIKNS
ncbi:hypothetical protein [Pseudalkalibacillus hwajinpoensis]|uniref:hypothetical protein n=1 Tax=Guptibacillus hwajinpoensis TaxID=208199 RepID=UPI001CD60B25|nr:hypothetical protein [Pseudalkalibacillus hwajinpoensis]MCA0993733.1 hypothetical protein [Pseudalkalibacillus hwajinpoensis]